MDYTVQSVNKLGEGNEFGTPYNVKFSEEAETVFMLAKKAPVEGETEHGNITNEPTKKDPSKTYRRFKRAQKDGGSFTPGQSSQPKQIDHDSMYRCNALNNAVAFASATYDPKDDDIDGVSTHISMMADKFYEWLKGENKGYEAAKKTAESLKVEEKPEEKPDETFEGEDINLDDIPF